MKKPARNRKRSVSTARPSTWADAVNRFMTSLENEERSQHTTHHYRDDLRAFELWWTKARAGEPLLPVSVVEEDIREWKRHLKTDTIDDKGNTRKPATVNTKLAALKSFLVWCHKKDVIATLPAMPRRDKLGAAAVKWLEPGEQRRLIREASHDRNPRNLPMIKIMIGTGLRVAELVELEWRDIELSERKGTLMVREGKGCKPRTVPLSPDVREAFRRLAELDPKAGPKDPVLTSQRMNAAGDRRRLTVRGVQEALARYGIHPHQLRHSFGMTLQKSGTPLPVIAKLMGHTSVITTMQSYGTPSEADLRAAVASEDLDD
jgi:integrase